MTAPRDPRFQKTERLIEAAFVELGLERGGFDVSVSEIAARAHVGRSTFYLHYQDVAALSESIQERLLAMAESNMSRAVSLFVAMGPATLSDYFVPMVSLMRENRQALLLYLGPSGSAQFAYRVKQMGKAKLRIFFVVHDDRRTEYLIEYMAAAGLALIVHWLEDDLSMPVEELIALMGAILFKGPLAAGLSVARTPGG